MSGTEVLVVTLVTWGLILLGERTMLLSTVCLAGLFSLWFATIVAAFMR